MEKDVAESIKKDFDRRHGATWHCIVGRNFGNPSFLSPYWTLYASVFRFRFAFVSLIFFFCIWNGVCGFKFMWGFWVRDGIDLGLSH